MVSTNPSSYVSARVFYLFDVFLFCSYFLFILKVTAAAQSLDGVFVSPTIGDY